MSMLSLVGLWAPVVIWAGLIFYVSSIPGLKTELGVWDWVLRKMAHVTEFFVLTLFLFRAFRKTWSSWDLKVVYFWCGAVALLYAISDEVHQSFVPHRGPSVVDVCIDAIGIIGALCLVQKIYDRN